MKNMLISIALLLLSMKGLSASDESLVNKYTYEVNQNLFTCFAWWNYFSTEQPDSSRMNPIQIQGYWYVDKVLTPEQKAVYRQQFAAFQQQFDFYSDYLLMVLAVNSSRIPDMQIELDALMAYNADHGIKDNWTISRLEEMQPYVRLFNTFYVDAKLPVLLAQLRPWYIHAGESYVGNARKSIHQSLAYLRMSEFDFQDIKQVVILPNPLSGSGEMGPSYRGTVYDVKCHYDTGEFVFYPHEMIHNLIRHLTKDDQYKEHIERFVEARWDEVLAFESIKSYHDPVIFFDECLVRAIDRTIIIGKESQDQRDRLAKSIQFEMDRGFIFVEDLVKKLSDYEASAVPFEEFFPEFFGSTASSASESAAEGL